MIGSIVKNVRWRVTAVATIVVIPLVALACAAPGGGGGGVPPVPRPAPTSTIDRAQSLITNPVPDPLSFNSFSMTCGGSVQGQSFSFPQDASVFVDAPTTIHDGEHFSVWVTPGDFTVPSSVNTQIGPKAIPNVVGFILTLPLSPHLEYVDAVMTSSIPTDLGYPQLQVISGQLWYTLDGPLSGTITLPRVRIDLIAHGSPFDEIAYTMNFLKVTAHASIVPPLLTPVGVLCKPPAGTVLNDTFIVP